MDYGEMWWNVIPNPRRFIDKIVEKVISGQDVIISHDNGQPWPWANDFESCLEKRIETAEKAVKRIDMAEHEGALPGNILFKMFCKQELRDKYRSAIGHGRFLALHNDEIVLKSRYIYVIIHNNKELQDWNHLLSEYNNERSKSKTDDEGKGCFILEVPFVCDDEMRVISWGNYYHKYDSEIFSQLIEADKKGKGFIKNYISHLAYSIGDGDPEIISRLIDYDEDLLVDPISLAMKFVNDNGEQHRKNIWKAQIRMLFPKLEEFRLKLVNEFSDSITIPIGFKHQYGEEIESISDLELSDLIHLYHSGDFICPPHTLELMKEYKRIRNLLAHGEMCSYSQIELLLQ